MFLGATAMRKFFAPLVVAVALGIAPIASADPATDKARAAAVIAHLNGEHAKALQGFRPLAEQGDVPAQGWMGTLYDKGAGVPQDIVRAYMWKSIAAAAVTGPNKAVYIKIRDDIGQKMTAAQIKRAEEMARACQTSNYKQC